MSVDAKFRNRLEQLQKLDFNYDAKTYQEAKEKLGWNVDRYRIVAATEAPGSPVKDGAFDRIKNAILFYKFPDPSLITAVFDPDTDLSGRNMLLRGHFLGLTFDFGVRITAVFNETRVNVDGDQEQVWGYAYRTLQGHFEVGEIRFEVCKNIRTGQIEFEIDAYSKPDRIPNFIYRIGFKMFGRTLQKYFAKSSLQRVRELASGPAGNIHYDYTP